MGKKLLFVVLVVCCSSVVFAQVNNQQLSEALRQQNQDYKRYIDQKFTDIEKGTQANIDDRFEQFRDEVGTIQGYFKGLVIKAVVSVFGIFLAVLSLMKLIELKRLDKVQEIDTDGILDLDKKPYELKIKAQDEEIRRLEVLIKEYERREIENRTMLDETLSQLEGMSTKKKGFFGFGK